MARWKAFPPLAPATGQRSVAHRRGRRLAGGCPAGAGGSLHAWLEDPPNALELGPVRCRGEPRARVGEATREVGEVRDVSEVSEVRGVNDPST